MCKVGPGEMWCKIVRNRQTGSTAGSEDMYLVSPDGRRLRSTHDLAKYILSYNLFDQLNPYEVNFEKPLDNHVNSTDVQTFSKNTMEFIQWYESAGKTLPSFMTRIPLRPTKERRPSKKKSGNLKLRFNTKKIKMNKCGNCGFWEDLEKQPNGENLCRDCRLGPLNPYRVLQGYLDRCAILPLQADFFRLQKQTRLSELEISQWFQNAMSNPRAPAEVLQEDLIPDFDIKAEKNDEEQMSSSTSTALFAHNHVPDSLQPHQTTQKSYKSLQCSPSGATGTVATSTSINVQNENKPTSTPYSDFLAKSSRSQEDFLPDSKKECLPRSSTGVQELVQPATVCYNFPDLAVVKSDPETVNETTLSDISQMD